MIGNARGPSFTIPNNTAVSQTVDWEDYLRDAEAITVGAPAALDALTYTWEISHDDGVTWLTLSDSAGNAIGVPAAGKATTFNGIFAAYTKIRLKASGNVTADRTWTTMKAFHTR